VRGDSRTQLRWVRPPRQARSQATLDRILDAAEALVAEKSFEDTTVAEVVRRAGSSVGAFYTRFRDKEGLLHALYDRYLQEATATTDTALDPQRWDGAAVPEILSAVVRFLVSVYRERRGLMRIFVTRNHSDAEFQIRRDRLSLHVVTRLSRLLLARRHEIGHPDPEQATRFCLTLVFSTLDSCMLFGEMRSTDLELSDEQLGTELTRACLAYLDVTPSIHD